MTNQENKNLTTKEEKNNLEIVMQSLNNKDFEKIWEVFKKERNLQFKDKNQERDILYQIYLNKLNPFLKNNCYLVSYKEPASNSFSTSLVVAYQKVVETAIQNGIQTEKIKFHFEKRTIDIPIRNKEKEVISFESKEDLYCEATYEGQAFGGYLSQYDQKKNLWLTKPYIMLKKCILVGLLRFLPSSGVQGFPYTQEEMPYTTIIKNEQKEKEKDKILISEKSSLVQEEESNKKLKDRTNHYAEFVHKKVYPQAFEASDYVMNKEDFINFHNNFLEKSKEALIEEFPEKQEEINSLKNLKEFNELYKNLNV